MTCELPGTSDRVVLYYPANKREYVLNLRKGDRIEFVGQLEEIVDWGFWRTGYVIVDK